MAFCVLHGFQASAGQPAMMSKALRKIGVDAFNVVVGGNKFGYPSDYVFDDASNKTKRKVLAQLAAKADVIHIHAITPFFNKGAPQFPMGTDLLALKAAGKRIIVHFRGSEIRLSSVFAASTPYHYVDDDPEGLISKFPEHSQRTYISMCQALADQIVVSDPELGTYVENAAVIPRVIDFAAWQYVGLKDNNRPLVVHAPSRRGVKGTKYVLAAVESLKAKGVEFDFTLVENMPQSEARKILEKCDILVDQLRIGWYGVLAVEGMALGKCVVSYVREDLEKHLGDNPPIKIANPDTIESALLDVIQSQEERMRIAKQGYEYCRSIHDPIAVAETCKAVYENIMHKESTIDFARYMDLNAEQETTMHRKFAKLVRLSSIQTTSKDMTRRWFWRKLYQYYNQHGAIAFLKRVKRKLASP